MNIGTIEVLPVLDGSIVGKLQSTKPLPDPGSDAWQQQHGMFRPGGLIESTVGGFLVRAGDRLALVDAGLGQDFPDGYSPPRIDLHDLTDPLVRHLRERGATEQDFQHLSDNFSNIQVSQGQLPTSLRALGVDPEDDHRPDIHPPPFRPHRLGICRGFRLISPTPPFDARRQTSTISCQEPKRTFSLPACTDR